MEFKYKDLIDGNVVFIYFPKYLSKLCIVERSWKND